MRRIHRLYLTTHYPGVLDEGQAVPLEIHAGTETRINLSLLTGRAYRVSGTVTGVPAKGRMTQIMLQAKGTGGLQMAPQELGEGGRFEFTNVLPGSYVPTLMVVTFEGGQPAIQMLRLGQSIEVGNAHLEGLRLQPEVGGEVRGKFRLDTGEKFDWTQLTVALMPAEEDGVEIAWQQGGMGIPTVSGVNIDGAFEMKSVPGGSYQLVVGARSDRLRDYITKSVNVEGRDVIDSGFSVLPETNLDVVISAKGASIAGTVVDSKDQPVANAIVVDIPGVEHRMRPDLYQRDTTDESGHFNLRGLNPGKYTVLAFEELQEDVRQPGFLKSYEKRGDTVELEEGTRKNILLKVVPTERETP